MPKTLTLTAADADAGLRLDKFLARRCADLSRSRLQALLQEGAVQSGGAVIAEPSHRVKPGEAFELTLAEPRPAVPRPQAIPLDVVYEDGHLLVLDKPAGLVVHPAPGHAEGTLVNALLAHCGATLSGIGGVLRPGIVHRLDREASGLLVVAKHDRAHVRLAAQFSVHTVDRVYDAVAWGVPSPPEGKIDAPIGRDPTERKRMAIVRRGGKAARTRYRLEAATGTLASWVRCELATGRTHQIRVHMASIGHPLVGDPLYGARQRRRAREAVREALSGFNRIALHARVLGFEHPVSGERLRFERPPPREMIALFERLRRAAAQLMKK
jgi:23S rRNA pseudouridine1911/1915/1917 synthase